MRSLPCSLVAWLATAACTTPCDDLEAHAESCGVRSSRPVDDRQSDCTALRAELTPAEFDPYATCVIEAECSEAGRIARCHATHLPKESEPCPRLRLWAAACSLEPIGVANDCDSLRQGMTEPMLNRWVTCMTGADCPRGDDPRYDRCQEEILPTALTQLIDACTLITAWNSQCSNAQPELLPVVETDLLQCVALAEPFSAPSFLAYGECLAETACDDTGARLACLLELELLDSAAAVAPCERLVARAAVCDSPLGGGTVEACARIFARFSPASLAEYVTCIEAAPCDDGLAAVECAGLLRLL